MKKKKKKRPEPNLRYVITVKEDENGNWIGYAEKRYKYFGERLHINGLTKGHGHHICTDWFLADTEESLRADIEASIKLSREQEAKADEARDTMYVAEAKGKSYDYDYEDK
jgi:hypothetical protein